MTTITRGDCFQLGTPDASRGWEDQPALFVVTTVVPGAAEVVGLLEGEVSRCNQSALTEDRRRGRVGERDMSRMLRKRVAR